MSSELASITSSEYQKLGIRDKIIALKHRAAFAANVPTDPAFENSFGDQLSDVDGRRRWVLVGLALQKWHKDLRDRVGEVLRENEGEIYKGRSIRGTATLRHCWMMGYDRTCAHPTVIISCDQSSVLKRTMRAISQHGVLKAEKFALKGVPFCDLKLRTEPGEDTLGKGDYDVDGNHPSLRNNAGHDFDSSWTATRTDTMRLTSSQSRSPGPNSHRVERKMTRSEQPDKVEDTARGLYDPDVPPQAASAPQPLEKQLPLHQAQDVQRQEVPSLNLYYHQPPPTGQETETRMKEVQKEHKEKQEENGKESAKRCHQQPSRERRKDEKGKQEESSMDFNDITLSGETKSTQHDLDNSDDDEAPLIRFGAEGIIVPRTGRSTTLGGFLMVDDVCFGLTAAHAFTEDDPDLEQPAIAVDEREVQLYDSDWANEDTDDDDDDENEGVLYSNLSQKAHQEQRLQRKGKTRIANDQTYMSSSGDNLHITAKSRLRGANGLDWALCELDDCGKYPMNGVYLPPELRCADAMENLFFRRIKTTPPLGKVLVATRRGAISGLGTGSDCAIKLGSDDRYRYVWSIQLEESLSSGDSGSWVVDAGTGDVYGIVVAGSTALREEYIIPAVDIGQDICRTMRVDTVRLPNLQDVMAAHTKQSAARRFSNRLRDDTLGWETDDSAKSRDEKPLDEEEKRFLLAEVLKNSSIDTETLVKVIKDAGICPKWTKMALPKVRSLKVAQMTVDRLLSSRRSKKSLTEDEWAFKRPKLNRHGEQSFITEDSISTNEDQDFQSENDTTNLFEEPPELLDSNPNFRAGTSRRAWRAKRRAEKGPKPHHRKYRSGFPGRRSSGIPQTDLFTTDLFTQIPEPSKPQSTEDQNNSESPLADEQGGDDPDIIILKHKGSTYISKLPPFSIAEGSSLIGHLRQRAAREFGVEDASRVTLVYSGKTLKSDTRTCHEEGLRMGSEVLCVIKRTASEEVDFLSNKFHTELLPQGLEFISNTPIEAKRREFEYKKISETIMTQILLKADVIEAEGDKDLKTMRKALVKEVQSFLNNLDLAAKKDEPSAWHADFIPQKQETGPFQAGPSLQDRATRSFGSTIRRSSTRDGEGFGSSPAED